MYSCLPRGAVLTGLLLFSHAGSELTLANDVECFWLSGRAVTPSSGPMGVSRLESQDSEAMSLHSVAPRGGLNLGGAVNGGILGSSLDLLLLSDVGLTVFLRMR